MRLRPSVRIIFDYRLLWNDAFTDSISVCEMAACSFCVRSRTGADVFRGLRNSDQRHRRAAGWFAILQSAKEIDFHSAKPSPPHAAVELRAAG
jgi:hypothetical protein